MTGEKVTPPEKSAFDLDYVGVKASQFSFSRLQKADPVLGVDMASTGEVGCIGDDTNEAVLKAMLSVGYTVPGRNILISSGDAKQKVELLGACKLLAKTTIRYTPRAAATSSWWTTECRPILSTGPHSRTSIPRLWRCSTSAR